MTATPTGIIECLTCGEYHPSNTFGECPRWAEPLFDGLTAAELDKLTEKLGAAVLETTAEADALARMDRRAQRAWPRGFAYALYGVTATDYHALSADIRWLFSEAVGTLEARA